MTPIFNVDEWNNVFLVKGVENFYILFAVNAFVNGKGVPSLHILDNKDVISNDTLSEKQGSSYCEYPYDEDKRE